MSSFFYKFHLPSIKIKYKYLAYMILMYPSVPFFNIGWGSNIPFLFISLIIIYYNYMEENKIKTDRVFILLLLCFFTMTIALLIVYYRIGDFNFKVFFVGVREFIINVLIIYSILIVYKKVNFNTFFKGLILGVYFNFFYGVLELFYPNITLYDPFFHELGKDMYKDYFLSGNAERIRLLWTEPSMAGVYMAIFVIPLGLLIKNKKEKIFYFSLWAILFLSIFSKGTILFLSISLMIYSVFNFKRTIQIIFKPYVIFIVFITVIFLFFNNNFIVKMNYIFTILGILFENFLNGNFDIISIFATSESISFSQSGRFITIYITLNILINDFYTLITGFTPFGYGYYKYLNEDLIPEAFYGAIAYKDYITMFNSKDSTQSSFLEMYGYYGLPIVVFLWIIIKRYYRLFKNSKLLNKNFLNVYFIWMLLLLFFMMFYHIIPVLVTLYLLFKKYNETLHKKVSQ